MVTAAITVCTPTFNRHDLLIDRAIPSVEAQEFTDWQHVIVADGPDPKLRAKLRKLGYRGEQGKRMFVELGRNWYSFRGVGHGASSAATVHIATHLAEAPLIAYLDDDCEYQPHHLRKLAETLAAHHGMDFAYTQMRRVFPGREDNVGDDAGPRWSQIDGHMLLHKAELLLQANWGENPGVTASADFELVDAWMKADAQWVFSPGQSINWYAAGM